MTVVDLDGNPVSDDTPDASFASWIANMEAFRLSVCDALLANASAHKALFDYCGTLEQRIFKLENPVKPEKRKWWKIWR